MKTSEVFTANVISSSLNSALTISYWIKQSVKKKMAGTMKKMKKMKKKAENTAIVLKE
eukprot:CAMPEP_0170534842 /NCGR_PEP_ID=MMETSP0209-20121228/95358_1 /TAXON_ID=665100 ORGANISM="Litonotus pictus, Strain P1" /NCGR_SAMPLE_ID=MMETSP0209 /ASSEMBLY_ACC=CAM_ASM_000301 /LENGTH=57 /DNA_ID=CAMNT_0010834909 /DNA_START=89 /DNA_END=259 /DNA_ORIENTATION=+